MIVLASCRMLRASRPTVLLLRLVLPIVLSSPRGNTFVVSPRDSMTLAEPQLVPALMMHASLSVTHALREIDIATIDSHSHTSSRV